MKKEKLYKIFSKMPVLETERLVLRAMRVSDAEDMYDYAKEESVTEYLLWSPHNSFFYTKDYLQYIQSRYAVGDFYDWALVEKNSGKMIGTCGFTSFDLFNNSAEVGYVLNKEFWGQGIACEALDEVIRFGFEELLLHRIEAKFAYENKNSLKVMEKCNMQFEGVLRSSVMLKGSYTDIGICSILGEEYLTYKLIQEFSK